MIDNISTLTAYRTLATTITRLVWRHCPLESHRHDSVRAVSTRLTTPDISAAQRAPPS